MSYSSGKRYFQIAKCYENRMSFTSNFITGNIGSIDVFYEFIEFYPQNRFFRKPKSFNCLFLIDRLIF